MNRSARAHKSTKIPNVKLRPAPARPSEEDDFDEDGNAQAGPSRIKAQARGRKRADVEGLRDVEVSAMDRQKIRRMEEEDGVVDQLSHDAFHQTPSQLPFHGHILTYTSIPGDEKAFLNPLLISMGIIAIQPSLTTDCTMLISRSYDSPKYVCALDLQMPIFTPELIEEVHKRWIDGDDVGNILGEEWASFRLKPFQGAKIAVTGIEPFARRQQVISLIADNGGVYSKNLDRSCTHLIVANKEQNPRESQSDPRRSAKVEFALGQPAQDEVDEDGRLVAFAGPRVVWEGWLWDCLAYKGRWDEGSWDLRTHGEPPRVADSRAEKLRSEKEEQEEAKERDVLAARDLLAAVVAEEKPDLGGDMDMDDETPAERSVPPEELEPARLKRRPDSRRSARTDKPVVGTSKGHQALDQLLDSLGHAARPKIITSPAGAMNQDEGNSSSGPRPKLLAAQTTMDVNGKVSSLLRQSMLHTSRAEAFAPATTAVPVTSSSGSLSVPAPLPGSSSVVSTGVIAPTAQPQSSAAAADYTTPDLFLGLKFSYALRQCESGLREKEMMEDVLVRCGATLVSEEERLAGSQVDYIVIRLQTGRPFPLNIAPTTQLVTDCWVERCMYQKQVVSPDEHLVLRPLQKDMPLPGSAGLSIHITGFDEENTFYYKRLIRAMGAEFSLAFSRRKTTHLLCKTATPSGLKVTKALEWQVPVITVEWLIESVRAGELLPFEAFAVDPNVIRSNAAPASAKQPLGPDSSANLSIAHHGHSVLPVPNLSASSEHCKENAKQVESESVDSKRESQKSSLESRRLGLLPTEVNIAHGVVKLAKRSMVEDSVMDMDVDMGGVGSVAGPSRTREDALQLGPGVPRTERPPPRMAVPGNGGDAATTPVGTSKFRQVAGGLKQILTPEILKELEQADVHAEARQTRVMRRPRQNPRSRNPFAAVRQPGPIPGPSRLYSPAPELPDADMSGDIGADEAEDDGADESLRVVYADPVAEREKKRLLDAFVDRKSKRTKKA